VPYAVPGGVLLLEAPDAVSEDQSAGAEDGLDGVEDVLPLGLVLRQVVPDVGGHG
jgi:hypothetical protein